MKCYRCMRINSMSAAKCGYCGEQLNFGKIKQTTGAPSPVTIGFDPSERSSSEQTLFATRRPVHRGTLYGERANVPITKPIDVIPVGSLQGSGKKFGHSTVHIPEADLLLKGNPISNAQQIERNRGQVSVNKNQQSFLTLKNKNFIETEYGDNTNLFGNYAPDEDDYETTTQEPTYNYKKSADELMKERNNM